jgi:hypothetical protein
MVRNEFTFPSADGSTQIHAVEWLPDGEVQAVLQIAHGVSEYILRYEPFASWLTERGFEIFDFGDRELERNDVLWMPGHTGLYIGEGMQAEALRDEHHGKGDGAEPGDQDQGETVVRPLTYGWKQVLRKPGAATSGSMEGDDMTFLFTTDGVHADHVYLYDGLQVRTVATYDQQEVVKEAYRRCHGAEIPMFHLAGGDHLIALVNSGPVS